MKFPGFLLIFLAFPVSANPTLTLEKFNTLTLNPTFNTTGKKTKYIPAWFDKIKKNKKVPTQGVAFVPTNKISAFWDFKKGIPSNLQEPIFIHSCPRGDFQGRLFHGSQGYAIRYAHAWLKNSILNGTMVSFDYLYDGKDFDLGQGINIKVLKKVYDEVALKNPNAPLVLAGTCMGAKIALEFASINNNPSKLKAMILESPFIDVKKMLFNLGKNYLGWLPFTDDFEKASVIKSTIQTYAPTCKSTIALPAARLENINPKLPIFIAHLKNDTHYTDEQMHQLISDLRKSGNTDIYLMVIKDSKTKHGRLNQKKEFSQAVNAFLAQHNLPHNTELAKEGAAFLADSKYNAEAASNASWRVVISEK